jgi:hypothetical protein
VKPLPKKKSRDRKKAPSGTRELRSSPGPGKARRAQEQKKEQQEERKAQEKNKEQEGQKAQEKKEQEQRGAEWASLCAPKKALFFAIRMAERGR